MVSGANAPRQDGTESPSTPSTPPKLSAASLEIHRSNDVQQLTASAMAEAASWTAPCNAPLESLLPEQAAAAGSTIMEKSDQHRHIGLKRLKSNRSNGRHTRWAAEAPDPISANLSDLPDLISLYSPKQPAGDAATHFQALPQRSTTATSAAAQPTALSQGNPFRALLSADSLPGAQPISDAAALFAVFTMALNLGLRIMSRSLPVDPCPDEAGGQGTSVAADNAQSGPAPGARSMRDAAVQHDSCSLTAAAASDAPPANAVNPIPEPASTSSASATTADLASKVQFLQGGRVSSRF